MTALTDIVKARRPRPYVAQGNVFAECMKDRGITQVVLSHKLSTTQPSISLWRRGVGRPSLAHWPKLREILGIDCTIWLSGDERAALESSTLVRPALAPHATFDAMADALAGRG